MAISVDFCSWRFLEEEGIILIQTPLMGASCEQQGGRWAPGGLFLDTVAVAELLTCGS